jgi:hypothetical protein
MGTVVPPCTQARGLSVAAPQILASFVDTARFQIRASPEERAQAPAQAFDGDQWNNFLPILTYSLTSNLDPAAAAAPAWHLSASNPPPQIRTAPQERAQSPFQVARGPLACSAIFQTDVGAAIPAWRSITITSNAATSEIWAPPEKGTQPPAQVIKVPRGSGLARRERI